MGKLGMRRVGTAVLLATLVGGASPAPAATIDLSWDACSPLVAARNSSGPGQYSLFVSATGQSQGHRGYQFNVLYRVDPPGGAVPDAWRFDLAGCQTLGLITIRHTATTNVAKTCPSFQGNLPSIQIRDVSYDLFTSRARVVLANQYSAGIATANPATRYLLGEIRFEHVFSVSGLGTPGETCGGFEKNMEFRLRSDFIGTPAPGYPSWLDLDGVTHDFELGQSVVTFCGDGCPVPAASATWGGIKGQYRR